MWKAQDSILFVLQRWEQYNYPYKIVVLSNVAHRAVEFARGMLEWMNENVHRRFDDSRHHPMKFQYVPLAIPLLTAVQCRVIRKYPYFLPHSSTGSAHLARGLARTRCTGGWRAQGARGLGAHEVCGFGFGTGGFARTRRGGRGLAQRQGAWCRGGEADKYAGGTSTV